MLLELVTKVWSEPREMTSVRESRVRVLVGRGRIMIAQGRDHRGIGEVGADHLSDVLQVGENVVEIGI